MCTLSYTSNAFCSFFAPPADSSVVTTQRFSLGSEGKIDATTYRLGPGDKLLILVAGLEELSYTITVDNEGNLYIPRCGIISVEGVSFANAKDHLKRAIQKFYKNVEIFITLTEFRWIRVSVQGMIGTPGTVTVQSNTRLSDVITLAGGFLTRSNSRIVRILSRNGTSRHYDLLRYFRQGTIEENPYLTDGDFVFVSVRDRIISIDGAVAFPGTYDLKDGEPLADFVLNCGGFLEKAKKDSIELIRFQSDGRTQRSMFFSDTGISGSDAVLHSHDRVIVRERPLLYKENLVYVRGHVTYPGPYKITEGVTTLTEIIHHAGGFLPSASLRDAVFLRQPEREDTDPEYERIKTILRADMSDDEYDYLKAKARSRKSHFVVDFVSLFEGQDGAEDVRLKHNDVIIIPEKVEYVTIIGQVVTPGKIQFEKKYKVSDYITAAGGFAWRAQRGDVRVVKANTGEWIEEDDADNLQPGDVIWVPEEPPSPRFWDVVTKTLNIVGQVATVIAATVAVIVATR